MVDRADCVGLNSLNGIETCSVLVSLSIDGELGDMICLPFRIALTSIVGTSVSDLSICSNLGSLKELYAAGALVSLEHVHEISR